MRKPRLIVSLLLALTGAACASRTAATTATGPATLRVGISDSGSKVTMHAGDTLVITLPKVDSPVPGAPSSWYLAPYAPDILEAGPATPLDGRFEFVAKAKGSGEIKLFGGCWPGPITDERPPCPNSVAPGSSPLPAIFTVTVVVT